MTIKNSLESPMIMVTFVT